MITKKPKLGRPTFPEARNVFIGLKVSAAERAALVKAAKRSGLSLSAYIMAPHRAGRKP